MQQCKFRFQHVNLKQQCSFTRFQRCYVGFAHMLHSHVKTGVLEEVSRTRWDLNKSINYLSQTIFSFSFFLSQGDLSTTDEMCLSFVLYYPKVNVTKCMSREKPAYYAWAEKYYKYVCLQCCRKFLTAVFTLEDRKPVWARNTFDEFSVLV